MPCSRPPTRAGGWPGRPGPRPRTRGPTTTRKKRSTPLLRCWPPMMVRSSARRRARRCSRAWAWSRPSPRGGGGTGSTSFPRCRGRPGVVKRDGIGRERRERERERGRERVPMSCIGFFFFDVERLFSSFSFVLFLVLFLALPLSYRIISMCFSKRSAADRERKPKVWSRGQKERKAKEATHAIDGRRCRRLLLFSSSSLFTITILYSLPGNIQCHRLEKTTPISRKPGVSRSSERASERARERERERERERKINKGRSQQRSSPKEAEKKKWALEGTLFATEKQNQSTDIDLSCIAFFRR